MSSYGLLTIGELIVSDLRDGISNHLLAVFRDEWLVVRATTVGEWDPDQRWTDEDAAEPVTVYEYRAPAEAVLQRLDALGSTAEIVMAQLESDLHGEGRVRKVFADSDATPSDLAEYWLADDAALDALTPEQWLQRMQTVKEPPVFRSFHAPVGSPDWLYNLISGWWPPYALRAALMAFPDREVRLDVTRLVEDDLHDGETPETLASQALNVLRLEAAGHAPIVILTEGRTDAEFLQAGMDILYPHLDDVLRFLDYSERPDGGAGALVWLCPRTVDTS